MHFFNILPLDVRLTVFQTWLWNAQDRSLFLFAVSDMDSACCNHSSRKIFLSMLTHPSFSNMKCANGEALEADSTVFLHWLSDRKLPLKLTLLFESTNRSHEHPASLPTVTTLTLFGYNSPDDLRGLLHACSCLTSVTITPTGREHDAEIWANLLSAKCSLNRLIYTGNTLGVESFCAFFAHYGRNLEELRLTNLIGQQGDYFRIHCNSRALQAPDSP